MLIVVPLWHNNHFPEIHCNFVVTKQLGNCLKFCELESYDFQRVESKSISSVGICLDILLSVFTPTSAIFSSLAYELISGVLNSKLVTNTKHNPAQCKSTTAKNKQNASQDMMLVTFSVLST